MFFQAARLGDARTQSCRLCSAFMKYIYYNVELQLVFPAYIFLYQNFSSYISIISASDNKICRSLSTRIQVVVYNHHAYAPPQARRSILQCTLPLRRCQVLRDSQLQTKVHPLSPHRILPSDDGWITDSNSGLRPTSHTDTPLSLWQQLFTNALRSIYSSLHLNHGRLPRIFYRPWQQMLFSMPEKTRQ